MTTGMKPFPVQPPWKGIIFDMPSGTDPQAFDTAQNIVFRHGRIQTRPKFLPYVPTPPDGQIIRGLYSFLDVLSNWHTLVLTDLTAYFLTNPSGTLVFNKLNLPAGLSTLGGNGNPYSIVEMNQKLFFSNGAQNLLYVDGSANVYLAGDAPGGCFFLTENSSHLIGVNWIIPAPGITGSTPFPFYVQISDAGNPFEWVPSLSNSATVINLSEKGGTPTGCCTLGTYTYVWRSFGANVLWPTGNAAAPFFNEPFTWSNPGWGNFLPYSLVTWNQSCVMVTHDGDVVLFNGANGPTASAFQSLAQGKIKVQLSMDLQQTSSEQVVGFITDQLGPGYDFTAYVLWIPGIPQAWVLNLEDGTWQTWTSQNRFATAFGNIKVH